MEFSVRVADKSDYKYASIICDEISESAKVSDSGIAKRSVEYLKDQMASGKAIIAFASGSDEVAGFCYIKPWADDTYVATSGLIIFSRYRRVGLAREIKSKAFELSNIKYPEAKLFGLTTSMAVMKINSELGYRPAVFSELTDDQGFWDGCKSCVNYEILKSKQRQNCLCTAMVVDPEMRGSLDNKEK